jgi:hypothetical protein
MRTIATLAGLVALASVSAQAAPLPPAKATRVELGTAPSNWCAKDAGGVGTASTGGIVGAIGIGVAASRTGEGAFLPPG